MAQDVSGKTVDLINEGGNALELVVPPSTLIMLLLVVSCLPLLASLCPFPLPLINFVWLFICVLHCFNACFKR